MNNNLHCEVYREIQRIIAKRNEKLPNMSLNDVSNEVFLRYLHRYGATAFTSAPIALLIVIVHNLYVDAYRRAASERAYREEKCYTDANRAAETPEAALIQAERRLRLKQALDAPLGQTGVSVRELAEAKLDRRFGEFAQKIGLSPYFLRRLEVQTIRRLREA